MTTLSRRLGIPLVVMMALSGWQVRALAAGRVVAMTVVDTNTKLAGIDVDRRGILSALQNGLRPGELLIHDDITGDQVRRVHVLDRLRSMPVGADDTVFFYYSGHGAVLANVDHALTTTGGDILRSEVRSAIQAKNPRLAIILTDCCANVVRRPPRPSAPAGQARVCRASRYRRFARCFWGIAASWIFSPLR